MTAPTSPTCLTADSNENPGRTRETRNRVQITRVTHQIEDGTDPGFVQRQVGHRYQSTTAIYSGVSGDFMNTMMRKALSRAFEAEEDHRR
jgi:integrase/recombinase XerC